MDCVSLCICLKREVCDRTGDKGRTNVLRVTFKLKPRHSRLDLKKKPKKQKHNQPTKKPLTSRPASEAHQICGTHLYAHWGKPSTHQSHQEWPWSLPTRSGGFLTTTSLRQQVHQEQHQSACDLKLRISHTDRNLQSFFPNAAGSYFPLKHDLQGKWWSLSLHFTGTFPGHGNSSSELSGCMQKEAAADAASIIQHLRSPRNNANLLH